MSPALVLGAIVVLAALPSPAPARDYGRQGEVWSVAETDLLAQIHGKLVQLEKTGETARLNAQLKRRTIARVNRPIPVAGLTRAEAPRKWSFDPTITVSENVADDKGRLILAAGTRVNPLDTVPLRHPLVFIDGDDPEQLAWATARNKPAAAKIILVKGAPLELMKERQHRFYFDQGGKLVSRFGIRAVPAVIEQQGRVLTVSEIPFPRAKGKSL
ncbi:type-F conjugative transfer system protein TraW [Novosphingobium sp. PC22D]|uniref:type-F conjugative transfer system protein TraW n=1 Tax=Novosphingobium sp. PC22D TaxID=1962403 RepID=UPI000BF1C806|nr:type-F conjugative transfer system protein TraW [Novosphingobium sp. PC22D]PEQ10359.1 type-F conjugative transfer system protein TraW [Novosphingobium sp. PC22D]